MPITMYIVSVVGILTVIAVVYFVFGNDTAHFTSDQEVEETAAKTLKKSIKFDDFLYNIDKTVVVALHKDSKQLVIGYAHGIHKNMESIPPQRFRSCSLRESSPEQVVLSLQIESFDRSHFDLALSSSQKAEAERWLDTLIHLFPRESVS
ncbi:MAG: hypothetical protein EP343_34275 [Deltaproteobacteria bacterium]|nr:MAG: hypothetical protein EP343_34275 [Deltaproteobacteria bacterium]